MKKGDGGWEDKEEGKREIIANYCSNIFRSNGPMNFQALLSCVPPAVTSEMNQQLLGDFSSEEVKGALESIGDLKAPGPDGNGIPSVFYKNCWDLLEAKVVAEALNFLNGGEMPDDFGMTHTSLLFPR